MNRKLSGELREAVGELDADDEIGCIVLTGAGERAFSAGGDIHEQREDDRRFSQEELDARRGRNSYEIAASAKPTIGMLNGLAYGGAAVLAPRSTCGLVARTPAFAFWRRPMAGSTAPGSCPTRSAGRSPGTAASARVVEAEEAYRIGLLNHLVPRAQLRAKTMELARMIAGNNRAAVVRIKSLLLKQMAQTLEQQWGEERDYTTHVVRGARAEEAFPNSSPATAGRSARCCCWKVVNAERGLLSLL